MAKPYEMKYKHLFFDLDHTLWDFESNSMQTLWIMYEEFGLASRGIPDFEQFHVIYRGHNTRLWDKYSKSLIKQDELRWKRMWLTLVDHKIADESLAREISSRYLQVLPHQKILFAYSTEILDYLKHKGYIMHIISNGFEEIQFNKLDTSGLRKYFTHIITSERSLFIKPQKEIFEFALHVAGAMVTESIMIGDNQEADIQGASNAGMDTVFVNHINEDSRSAPTYTILHLKELENIL
jgi:putative hydrolase of the HAD superfamily